MFERATERMLMTIGLCIFGGQPMMITMRRRLSIPSDAFGRTGAKGKGLIKSAGVGRRSDLSVLSLRGHFGAASFLTPSSPLSSSPQSFALGLAGTYWSPFLFLLFYDISWTLMTQTTVTSLITTRHTPTLT